MFGFIANSLARSRDGSVEKLVRDGCGWVEQCPVQISMCHRRNSLGADPAETDGSARADTALQELHLLMVFRRYNPAEPRSPSAHKGSEAKRLRTQSPEANQHAKLRKITPNPRPDLAVDIPHTHTRSKQLQDGEGRVRSKATMWDPVHVCRGVAHGPEPPCATSATVQRGSSP